MKLGEALLIRSDLLRQLASLKERLAGNAIVQEGDKPQEEPAGSMAKIDANLAQFEELAVKINIANMQHSLPNGITLTAALAKRDVLVMQHAVYGVAVEKGRAATTSSIATARGRSNGSPS